MSASTTGDKEESRKLTVAEEVDYIARSKLFEAGAAALTGFTSRLGGGGFGDLRIEGSKADGHEELFRLREQLLQIQDDLSKTATKHPKCSHLEQETQEEETSTLSKKTIKMSNNSSKAMESIVERQTSDKFRDISIKFDSMAEQIEKAKKQNCMLEEEIERIKEKTRKRATSTVSLVSRSEDQHRTLVKRVEKLEKAKKSSNLDTRISEVEDRIGGDLETRVTQLDTQHAINARLFSSRIQRIEEEQISQAEQQLEAKVDRLSSDNKDLVKQVWDLGLGVDNATAVAVRAERRAMDCEKRLTGLGGKVDGLTSMGAAFGEQFSDLEERIGDLDSSVELSSLAVKADSHIGRLDKRIDMVAGNVKALAEQLATSRRRGWIGWFIQLMRGSRSGKVSGSDVYHDIC